MAMYVTGDLHGNLDWYKMFRNSKLFKEDDTIFLCGDFGCIWHNNVKDDNMLNKLSSRLKCTVAVVLGNHENYDAIEKYPTEHWNGGMVYRIRPNTVLFKRGEIFTINNKTFFTMSGGSSIDIYRRTEGISWWKQEVPTAQEIEYAMDRLDSVNWKVDYILTHTTSTFIMVEQMDMLRENSILNQFLDEVQRSCTYKHWYFGHFHLDEAYNEVNATCVYNKILQIL